MRGLTVGLGHGYKLKAPQMVVDHLVIGAGVVGLAIGQKLVERFPGKSTYVVERHERAGEETSSRNSEVIHAGLYYPADSLKTRLCLRGRVLLYSRCQSREIPHSKLGKLVVGLPHQEAYLRSLHDHCNRLKWPPYSHMPQDPPSKVAPTELISGEKAREMEPDLSPNITLALWSSETGIIDSHALMDSFEDDITSSEEGELVYNTKVVRVDPIKADVRAGLEGGWVVQTSTSDSEETDSILAKTLINASGLSSHQILNHLLPQMSCPQPPIPIYYARGSYASYRGPGVKSVSRLIYPVPEGGQKLQSLGTHLTLDMNGNVRFGPDVEWIEPPSSTDEHSSHPEDADYWRNHLIADESRLQSMHDSITSFLPNVQLSGLSPDYVGIRPKLGVPGGPFNDFVIRVDKSGFFLGAGMRRDEGETMITLMGIESPGLTSSMALAEMVVDKVLAK
ncbi:hypothetical protein FRC03_007008 [Tulasnella sp. 419]|nr:hypothetical protein FRC03_007008 [Tulasnella sp. 419]